MGLTDDWVDVQKVFSDHSGIRRIMKLSDAIDLCGITFRTHAHDALSDAAATAELFFELQNGSRNILLISSMLTEEGESCGTCMGDLFSGLSLAIA